MIETIIVIVIVLLALAGVGWGLYRGATGKDGCASCPRCDEHGNPCNDRTREN